LLKYKGNYYLNQTSHIQANHNSHSTPHQCLTTDCRCQALTERSISVPMSSLHLSSASGKSNIQNWILFRISRRNGTGLWATRSGGRCPCSWQGGWD